MRKVILNLLIHRCLRRKNSYLPFKLGLLIAIAFGYSRFATAQGPQASGQQFVTSISAALRDRDFANASKLSQVAVRTYPSDPRLWTLQGVAYMELGMRKRAFSSFHHALHISPDYLPALKGASQLAYLDTPDGNRSLADHILKLQPEDPSAHAILAEIYFKDGKCESAVEHFQRADQIVEDLPEPLTEFGVCLVNLGRFTESIPIFRHLVDLQPDNKAALYNLALVQWKSNRNDEAIRVLDPLIESADPEPSILVLAADVLESKGDTQGAIDLLRKAIQLHPKNKEAYLDFAQLSANHNSFSVGIDMLNLGIQYLPNQSDLYLARGVLHCELGDTDTGVIDFETANRLDPRLSFPGIAEGIAESQAHKSKQAMEIFRVQAQKHPNDALAQFLFAEAISEQGEPEGSPDNLEEIRAAKLAVKLDPSLLAAHDLLATNYLRIGATDLAIQESNIALRIDSSDEQALFHLVLATRKDGNDAETHKLVERLLEARTLNQNKVRPVQRLQIIDNPPKNRNTGH